MNSKTPKEVFEIPEVGPNKDAVNKNSGFNIDNIPRFKNPVVTNSSTTLKDKVSQLKQEKIHSDENIDDNKSNTMPEAHKYVDKDIEKNKKLVPN